MDASLPGLVSGAEFVAQVNPQTDDHFVTILKVGTEWKLKTRSGHTMTLNPFMEAGSTGPRVKYFECLSV
jgi:hypothetical protein